MEQFEVDTGTPDLLASRLGRVLILSMHRPHARNALSSEMLAALASALSAAETDSDIGCIVLTGSGAGFCAGGDVKAMANKGGLPQSETVMQRQRLVQQATAGKLFTMPKPTIAMINGAAAGAGLSLALACDLRFMSKAAILTTAFARVGLCGDFGGTYFLSQLVGAAKARELYFLADRIDAETALRLGLANWICEPDALQSATMALAERLSSGPGIALGLAKENLNRALGGSLAECLDIEATHHIRCLRTEDHREAASAFVEKREPVFTGS